MPICDDEEMLKVADLAMAFKLFCVIPVLGIMQYFLSAAPLGTALTLCLGIRASAQTLYRAPIYDNSIRGGDAYRGGNRTYYTVPDNDIYRNRIYDMQLRDDNGKIYNCNNIGSCRPQ